MQMKNLEEISFYYWLCHTKTKRVAEKASGHSSDHLIFPRKKKSINEREIKK